MQRVYLAQINTSFGDNAFLPYSVGLLWAFAARNERIRSNYDLAGLLCQRLPLQSVVDGMAAPDILGLSSYIWNWEYNIALARMVKERWPGCSVIMGGPEVPNRSQGFFLANPFVDALIHGEGEEAFRDLLLARLDGTDLSSVDGLSIPGRDGSTTRTKSRQRSADIDIIPSPYMSGVFDDLMAANPDINWHASQETHRGCPYSCTFCDWGSAVYTKIREFSTERLNDEISWFGKHKIDLLYNCDANYGILQRDIELTTRLVEQKASTGFPRKFRASYAKRSDDKVFRISSMLNDAGMSKGVTLSLQSLDTETLSKIKRSNISMSNFSNLMARYRSSGIPTYTEIILGLPGETAESFAAGLEKVLQGGQHDSINIYPCMVLKNSEMGDPDYIAKHGIRHIRIPISSNHGVSNADDIQEYQDIIISTACMPEPEWKSSYMLAWIVQTLHCLGLTQVLAMQHRMNRGSYMDFYLQLLAAFSGTDTILGNEIARTSALIDGVMEGRHGFDRQEEAFGQAMWPPEELSFLRMVGRMDDLLAEIRSVIQDGYDVAYLDQLMDFQRNLILKPGDGSHAVSSYSYDMLLAYQSMLLNESVPTKNESCIIRFASQRYFHGDLASYAREIVWYGRKQNLQKMGLERIE